VKLQWAGYRENISPSGRGETFFLTSLFIELIDPRGRGFECNGRSSESKEGAPLLQFRIDRRNVHLLSFRDPAMCQTGSILMTPLVLLSPTLLRQSHGMSALPQASKPTL